MSYMNDDTDPFGVPYSNDVGISRRLRKSKVEKSYMNWIDYWEDKKRFKLAFNNVEGWAICDTTGEYSNDENSDWLSGQKAVDVINILNNENEELKQYRQAVNDVLMDWSQKNLTAKQLQVVIAIMEELNVKGDVE